MAFEGAWVRQILNRLVLAFCAALGVILCPFPTNAFDIGPVLDRLAMARLNIAPDETPLAIGGDDATQPFVAVALGESTFFIDRYGPDNKRISRSRPLPAQSCTARPNPNASDPWLMSLRAQAGGIVVYTNSCPTGDKIFFQDGDGNITSFVRPKLADATSPLEVRVWVRAKPQAIEPNLAALLAQMTDRDTGQSYPRMAIRQRLAPTQDPSTFATLVNRPLAQIGDKARHLTDVRAGVLGLDWRMIGDSRTLNNAAFHLSQGDDCRDLETAIAMMNHVVATTPTRHVTNLNLADAYAKAHALKCNNLGASLGQSQEAFRLYCTGVGYARVPAAIRNRYRAAMVVPKTEDGTRCQPQFGMQRAILASDQSALMRALADPENDVNVTFPTGNRALGLALERKQGDMARLIIAAGGDPDRASFYPDSDRKYEFTPLLRAIWNYDVETVRALVGRGRSNLEFTLNGSPYRPLLKALELRSRTPEQEAQKLAIIDLILSLDISPLNYDEDGKNAFYAAADGYSSQAVFDRVVAHGAFVNHPNRYGQTPLFAIGPFASQRAVETQAILLRLGANPNQQNQTGATPLINAFAWTNSDSATIAAMVAGLLEAGADPNIADQNGRTALNLAAMRAMPDTVDLLIAKGAKLGPTPRYQTDTLTFVRSRIADIEQDPTRETNCTCLADYKRILTALTR
jgi:uncharacterized protein